MEIIRLVCVCLCILLPVVASQCLSKTDVEAVRKQISSLEAKLKKNTAPVCGSGWEIFKGHCYYFSGDRKIWTAAESECRRMSSNLVKIDDRTENSWLKARSKANDSKAQWWIGARRVNNKWEWSADLSPLKFTDWAQGEPNSAKENCAHTWKGIKYSWNDRHCTLNFNYICEKEAKAGSFSH